MRVACFHFSFAVLQPLRFSGTKRFTQLASLSSDLARPSQRRRTDLLDVTGDCREQDKEQIIAACLLRGLVDALDQSAEYCTSVVLFICFYSW